MFDCMSAFSKKCTFLPIIRDLCTVVISTKNYFFLNNGNDGIFLAIGGMSKSEMKTSTWMERKTKTTLKELFRISWKWKKNAWMFISKRARRVNSISIEFTQNSAFYYCSDSVCESYSSNETHQKFTHPYSLHLFQFTWPEICRLFSLFRLFFLFGFFSSLDRMWDGKWLDSVPFYQLKLFDAVALKCAVDNEPEREDESKKCTKKFVNIYGNKPIMFDIN